MNKKCIHRKRDIQKEREIGKIKRGDIERELTRKRKIESNRHSWRERKRKKKNRERWRAKKERMKKETESKRERERETKGEKVTKR